MFKQVRPTDLPTLGRQIAAHSIIKEFHSEIGTRRVLDGISFTVGIGERLAVRRALLECS